MNLRPIPVVLVVSLATLSVLALGVTGAPLIPTPEPALAGISGVTPAAGGYACVTGAGASEEEVVLLLLAGPTEPEEEGQEGTRAVVHTLGSEGQRRAVGPVAPGALEILRMPLDAEDWLWTGWADRPLAAWQEWRTDGAPGQPRGAVAGECLQTDPPSQTVIGLRTDIGNEALLRLANPFVADATFAVTFVTDGGIVEPVALRNVSVPGGERLTVRLNEHVPEQSDIAAIVTVGAGRLAVEGLQRSIAAVGGIEGVSTVPPITRASATWTIPWLPSGPDVEASIWVLNLEPRAAVVELTVHTPQGPTVASEDTVEVGPGRLLRLDGADLAPGGAPAFGLTVRSDTTGVLVAAGAVYRSEDAFRTGLVRYAATPVPDSEWSIAGTAGAGRDVELHVVNLAESDADLRVMLTILESGAAVEVGDGEQGTGDTGMRSVVLTPGRLAPGASTKVALPVEGAGAYVAVVEGGSDLVVARTVLGRERLEPVTSSALASRAWRSSGRPLVGRPLQGWVARLAPLAPGGD